MSRKNRRPASARECQKRARNRRISLMLWRQAGSTGHKASFHTPTLGLSDYAPGLCDYADSLCRDYAPTNSHDYAEIMLLESDYAEIMLHKLYTFLHTTNKASIRILV